MTASSFENLTYETVDGAARITINRPDKLNALNRRTIDELADAAERALRDPSVRAVVLTGAGPAAFVAGADIAEMARLDAGGAQAFSRAFQDCLDRLERSPKPVLAAVNGFALGGGCELALACHVRFATDTAKFAQPEVNLGLIPGAGGTQRLPRLVGRGRALEMILGGEMIDAAEAHRIGLVNRVVPPAALSDAVDSWVRSVRAKSPVALSRAIEAVICGGEMPIREALALEAGLFGLCFATEDMREGTKAFLEKRKPSFPGR